MRKYLFVLALVAGCGEEEPETTATPCERLRDHVIELRLAEAKNVDKESYREIMRRSLGDGFLTSCANLDDEAVACALAAPDRRSVASCSPQVTH